MARASAIFNSRAPLGVMDDSETRIAMGAYDKARYEEYQRQVRDFRGVWSVIAGASGMGFRGVHPLPVYIIQQRLL